MLARSWRYFACCWLVLCCALGVKADDRSDLLEGVTEIVVPGGIPGDFVVFGSEVSVVLTGRMGKARLPVVAAAHYGKGRVIALGHEGFFGSNALKNPDNVRFTENIAGWVSGKSLNGLRIGAMNQDAALTTLFSSKGASVVSLEVSSISKQLPKVDALWLNQASLDGVTDHKPFEKVREWVRSGGGLVIAGPAWGWQMIHSDRDLRRDHSGNQLLLPMGIAFATGMLDNTGKQGFRAETNRPELVNADAALTALEAQAAGKQNLSPEQMETITTVLGQAVGALPEENNRFIQRVENLCRERGSEVIPTRETPITRALPFARLKATLDLQKLRRASVDKVTAHPSSASFPGAIPAGAKRETRQITIPARISGWHGTGLYAAPGEVITLSLPQDAVNKGLGVRIGAHTDTLWHLEKWERFPEVSLRRALDAPTVKVASAFGGGIFIEAPERGLTEEITVTISNAVAAPRFVRGVTSHEEWKTLRTAPAPWTELEGKLVILTVPSSAIRDLDDPQSLMAYWDEVMEHCYALYAAPKRNRPERYCVDRQISAGYMHSGYPIMTGDDVAKTFCNLKILRGSEGIKCWGFYHEMGHNFQMSEWTWDEFGEVTNNLFSLYGAEKMNGVMVGAHPAMTAQEMEKRVQTVAANPGAERYYAKDPWYPLTMFVLLRKEFGWKPFTELFAQFRDLPRRDRPRNEAEKRDQFLTRFSKLVGRNLTNYLNAWGVETTTDARAAVANLPDWMPAMMTNDQRRRTKDQE